MSGKAYAVVEFDRTPELRGLLQEVGHAARLEEAEALRDDAERIASQHSATGAFAGGFKVEDDRAHHITWVYNDAADAPFNEWGTVHRPATPALGPASHAAEGRFVDRVVKHLKPLLERYGGR